MGSAVEPCLNASAAGAPGKPTLSIVEFDPRRPAPAHLRWRYTLRPEWSSHGESLWMRLAKFSYLNRMPVAETARLFARQDIRPLHGGVDLRSIAGWNTEAVTSILELDVANLRAAFCHPDPRPPGRLGATACRDELRYCATCLQEGFHAAWFQWPHVERCPAHSLPLCTGCPHCGASIPYSLGSPLVHSPLRCPRCHCDWVPSLGRRRGQCAPLAGNAGVMMQRWADYALELSQVGPPIGRKSSACEPDALPLGKPEPRHRPHVLTLVNRLFDEPPPSLTTLTAQTIDAVAHRQLQAAMVGVSAHTLPLDYSLQAWPHFGADFAHYEHLLRTARRQLFVGHRIDFDGPSPPLRAIESDLVAATTAMSSDVAAALGWTVSWFGSSRIFGPRPDVAAPALGLTAWLSRIPVRPTHVRPRDWMARVTQWLLADLTLSACAWQRVAEFMSSRNHYLLHGDTVSPSALARRH